MSIIKFIFLIALNASINSGRALKTSPFAGLANPIHIQIPIRTQTFSTTIVNPIAIFITYCAIRSVRALQTAINAARITTNCGSIIKILFRAYTFTPNKLKSLIASCALIWPITSNAKINIIRT